MYIYCNTAEIWTVTARLAAEAATDAGMRLERLGGIGITNQRETIVLWDRATGEPLHHALVWQDGRTAERCRELKDAGHEPEVRERTGLVIDPYFSATKLAWLLDHLPGARRRAEAGELAAGTIDSWLAWKLTGGRLHLTDPTNASRTLLYQLDSGEWDASLLERFGVPRAVLPEIRGSSEVYGDTDGAAFGAGCARDVVRPHACIRAGAAGARRARAERLGPSLDSDRVVAFWNKEGTLKWKWPMGVSQWRRGQRELYRS